MSDPNGSTAQQGLKPTDLANAAAEEARRRRLGLPPLPRRRRDRARPVRLLLVWLVSVGLAHYLFPALGFTWHDETIAHAIGVAIPIFTSYLGHKHFSFARSE